MKVEFSNAHPLPSEPAEAHREDFTDSDWSPRWLSGCKTRSLGGFSLFPERISPKGIRDQVGKSFPTKYILIRSKNPRRIIWHRTGVIKRM